MRQPFGAEGGKMNVGEKLAQLREAPGDNLHRFRLIADLEAYPAGMAVRSEVDELDPRERVHVEERWDEIEEFLLLTGPHLRASSSL
jgi:hypothetical protein